ncbi:MAG: aminoacyl-tRNA hydrolase [bacterium]|nr:aminoacyl-tRNA hydrolase [bacterium]
MSRTPACRSRRPRRRKSHRRKGRRRSPRPCFRPLAVCDDIALPLRSLRLRAGGSDGGHRGLESLGRALGGTAFPRLRLGVDGSGTGIAPPDWADYVLAEFPAAQRDASEELVQDACDALLTWLDLGVGPAAGRHNRRGGRA